MRQIFDMQTLAGFVAALDAAGTGVWSHGSAHQLLRALNNTAPPEAGDLHCPRCGAGRRVKIATLFVPEDSYKASSHSQKIPTPDGRVWHRKGAGVPNLDDLAKSLVPSLFLLTCVQCGSAFSAMIADMEGMPSLVIAPSTFGGLRTPHTPPGVSYYLDQAFRAKSMSALSAALAMYRAALEHLLFEQGYKDGMLGAKIKQLDLDIAVQKAPPTLQTLETEFLTLLKQLGDGAIHPNDGDITRQASIDTGLIAMVEQTISHLLFLVYEAPHEKQQTLGRLRAAATTLQK